MYIATQYTNTSNATEWRIWLWAFVPPLILLGIGIVVSFVRYGAYLVTLATIAITIVVTHRLDTWVKHHTERYPYGYDNIPDNTNKPGLQSNYDTGQWENSARNTVISIRQWLIVGACAALLLMVLSEVRRRRGPPVGGHAAARRARSGHRAGRAAPLGAAVSDERAPEFQVLGLFPASPEPPFGDAAALLRDWDADWGCDDDVSRAAHGARAAPGRRVERRARRLLGRGRPVARRSRSQLVLGVARAAGRRAHGEPARRPRRRAARRGRRGGRRRHDAAPPHERGLRARPDVRRARRRRDRPHGPADAPRRGALRDAVGRGARHADPAHDPRHRHARGRHRRQDHAAHLRVRRVHPLQSGGRAPARRGARAARHRADRRAVARHLDPPRRAPLDGRPRQGAVRRAPSAVLVHWTACASSGSS